MRPRSAMSRFFGENVYAIAELIRRQKGGAAVGDGALPAPVTRNAQCRDVSKRRSRLSGMPPMPIGNGAKPWIVDHVLFLR